jgi:hypothetical protein
MQHSSLYWVIELAVNVSTEIAIPKELLRLFKYRVGYLDIRATEWL